MEDGEQQPPDKPEIDPVGRGDAVVNQDNIHPEANISPTFSDATLADLQESAELQGRPFAEPGSYAEAFRGYTMGDGGPTPPNEPAIVPLAEPIRTPEELLRRLSLVGPRRGSVLPCVEENPKKQHPNLKLSGNVISAAFCLPHKIGYAPGAEWILTQRHGTSALYDSFSYLASEKSGWNHTLVGWTGEIDRATNYDSATAAVNDAAVVVPINESSRPSPAELRLKKQHQNDELELKIPAHERKLLSKRIEDEHGGRVIPVWLPDDVDENDTYTLRHQQKWRKYGEHELFTLFHYKQNEPNDGRANRTAWADYYRMNTAIANAIMEVYQPGDVVVVHDYQLLLLPGLLRQRCSTIYVGFFLHIPFPSSEYYRCLTRRKEILEGVLGSNMIGFQAFSYSRHFSSCCTRILGFEASPAGIDAYGAHVAVDVFPIGINVDLTEKNAFDSPGVEEKLRALRELYVGRKVIVGRDRLDSVRGVAQKLQAFEIFLERHPEWHDKVVLIQVTSPTSIEERDEKNGKTASKISELVGRINSNFGSLSFCPVQHYPQYLSQDEYFALLRVADLGLITTVRDGMNTTALEYVVCQRDHHGPLIISEFSGTAGSLGDAMHINPWDLCGVADAIDKALKMSDKEKEATHNRLYKHVTTNTIQSWTNSYLNRLMVNLTSFDQSIATPVLDRTRMLAQYRIANTRLFMFDYDGTLTPIVRDPQLAIPSDRVIRTLKGLAADPRNAVWIISGRDQAFLDEWMGHIPELGLSAEHGSFIRMPNSTHWENLTEKFDMSWQKTVMEIFNFYTERTQGSFIERKKIALTWHYRRADPEYGIFQAHECQIHLENTVTKRWDVEVMAGKANLEVRPRFVNKGEIAKRLVNAYSEDGGPAPDFVLCLGDDFTDEDMFRSLRASRLPDEHVFAVTVGASSKQTLAKWHLLEPADVISAISMLNGSTDAGNLGSVAVVDGKVPPRR